MCGEKIVEDFLSGGKARGIAGECERGGEIDWEIDIGNR